MFSLQYCKVISYKFKYILQLNKIFFSNNHNQSASSYFMKYMRLENSCSLIFTRNSKSDLVSKKNSFMFDRYI